MATDMVLTLKIDKVGDLEALNALNALDAKGRRIIEGVSGATGRAMGEVALAYERGSKSARLSLEAIAKEHEKNIAAMVREERAADALGRRQGLATLSATRGVEQLVRSGTLLSSSLDQTISQVSQLAFGFGATGPIIGAIGVATVAMVNLFRKAHEETKKLAREMAEEINRISHEDLTSQALTAQRLYSGDEAATDITRFGIPALQAMLPDLQRRVKAGTNTRIDFKGGVETTLNKDARDAAEQLKLVQDRLAAIVPLYNSIMGVGGRGGTLERAAQRQAALDLPGFVTEDLAKGAKADKAADKLADRLAKEYQRALAHDLKEATKLAVAAMVEDAETTFAAQQSVITELVPTKKQIDASIKEVSEQISEAIKNDPFLAAQKAIQDLAARVQQEFGHVMGDAMAKAFETAFSGRGLKSAFGSLISAALSGLGGLMEAVGAQMIVYGTWVAKFIAHVATFDPIGQIEAGVGMIAAGALLKSIAGSFGHSGSGGGGGGGGSYGGSSALGSIIDRGVIDPNTYSQRSGASIPQRQAVTVNATIIGKDDPNAQRQIAEIVTKAAQRGWIGPAFA